MMRDQGVYLIDGSLGILRQLFDWSPTHSCLISFQAKAAAKCRLQFLSINMSNFFILQSPVTNNMETFDELC